MSILTRVQTNPEISTDNSAYVSELIARAKEFIRTYCTLPEYPELSQGTSTSAASPSEDITGIDTNELLISVNGSAWQDIDIVLANCDSGANAAAELQAQIRAIGDDSIQLGGFDEVTVTFTDSLYVFTSGRFGEDSAINLAFNDDAKHVALNLKLTPSYGGVEVVGGAVDDELDNAAVMLTEELYAKAGLEGLKSGTVPGGISFTEHDLDPRVKSILLKRRRLWT